MISNHDRSGYFGASDVAYVIGNWKTKTWQNWWMQKLGINQDHFDNRYTIAGTNWEHKILESLGLPDLEMDRQIIVEELKLRVNLDGNTSRRIKEVKTYKMSGISGEARQMKEMGVTNKYIRQTHIQMFASIRAGIPFEGADIVSYGLEDADYDNFFRQIDPSRVRVVPIAYDPGWVERVYLPKHMILLDCLKRGVMPHDALV